MSFNKKYLPELHVLEDAFKELGDDGFYIRYIKKCEAFIGPSESIDYINKFTEEYYKNKQT